MTESIKSYRDKTTKRIRVLNSVQTQEAIKVRLNQQKVSHLIYEGKEGENLKEIRTKLKPRQGCILQIRKNNIYEIRAKMKKIECIKETIKSTIKILNEKNLLNCTSSEDDIFKSVMNSFVNGLSKTKFTIKK